MAILANSNTRIIVQGITGREAATFVKDSLDYGSHIVAGVTPGKGGNSVHGVPVYDTVANALAGHEAEATIISVPPLSVLDAAIEAIENGIKLAVIVTERIPRRSVVQVLEHAQAEGTLVIGPNSLGLISPHECRVGLIGGKVEDAHLSFMPGPVGIMSRSGGMTTEVANMLTQAGIGQSTCISVGGDPIIGSNFLDLLPLFEADPATKVLCLFCEPGGTVEELLASRLHDRPSRLPIVAFVAGRFTDQMQGIRFGHAGVIVSRHYGSPAAKVQALKQIEGVWIAQTISDVPRLVQALL